MIHRDVDQGGAKYLPFATKKLRQLIRFAGVGVRTFKLPDADITIRATNFHGFIRIRASATSGWWPVIIPVSGAWDNTGFVMPVKSIALSSESGETVTAVNAAAIASKCSVAIRGASETLAQSYRFTEEFVEWCYVNGHLQLLKELCSEIMGSQTYKTNGVASDVTHEYPCFTAEALYFYRDEDGDVAGLFRPLASSFDSGAGYASTAANSSGSGTTVRFEVDYLDTGSRYILAKEYAPWVLLKRKVIYGIGVEWGNAIGSVVLDKDNPVYSFEAFGATINIDMPNLATAVSGLSVGDSFDTAGDPDNGTNTGECEYEVYATGTVILDGGVQKLQATVVPLITFYRGEAWVDGSPPTIDSDVYQGQPYSFGEFIDVRDLAYSTYKQFVASEYEGSSKSAKMTNTGLNYEGEWIDCTIFGDLHNGVFGVVSHVELTEQNFAIDYPEFVAQHHVEGFRIDESGYSSLTGSPCVVSDGVVTSGSPSQFDEVYQTASISQKTGLMNRTLATVFEGTYDWGYDTNTAMISWNETEIAVDAAMGDYSIPNQRLEITIPAGVRSVAGADWRRGSTISSPDMGLIVNVASATDGSPRVEVLYEGSVVKPVTAFAEDMLTHQWSLNPSFYKMPFVDQLTHQSQLLGGVLSGLGINYQGDYTLYQYADMPSKSRTFVLEGADTTANINNAVYDTYTLKHAPYMEEVPRSDETYESYLGFLYWPNASGTDRGIVVIESWCSYDHKVGMITYYYNDGITGTNFADFQTFVDGMLTEVLAYADPEPDFEAAVQALYDHVSPIGTPTTEEIADATTLLLAALRASYDVLVNNFAGATVLDMVLPQTTLTVADITPTTYLPELIG